MKFVTLALAGASLLGAIGSTAVFAQATSTAPVSPATSAPGTPVPASPGISTGTGTAAGSPLVGRNTGVAAAAGDRNQAVTTTSSNAPQPARGRNSFTLSEARRRLSKGGYATVSELKKDGNGVWRGSASKDGAPVGVWLDYKGNVGQQ